MHFLPKSMHIKKPISAKFLDYLTIDNPGQHFAFFC
jgi:hypothetical protein